MTIKDSYVGTEFTLEVIKYLKQSIRSKSWNSYNNKALPRIFWGLLEHYSLVAYAHFRALIYRTFLMLFSERYIPKKPFSRRSPKIQAREHPDPDTFKADMSVKISENWKFLNMDVWYINRNKIVSWVRFTIETKI